MSKIHDPAPTRPELAILKRLWRGKSLTARQIHDDINSEFDWSYSTLRTVLERMHEKGLVEKSSEGSANSYAANVSKVSLLGGMIADFSKRVLEIDGAPSTAFFAQSNLLSDGELKELEEMLNNAEEMKE